MPRTCAILIAESNLLLREKMAGVLARHPHVWCVVQVNDVAGLVRGAADLRPDIILAELNIFKDQAVVQLLKQHAPTARLVALADSATEPYVEHARGIGLDGVMEKARVGDEITKEIRALPTEGNTSDDETS